MRVASNRFQVNEVKAGIGQGIQFTHGSMLRWKSPKVQTDDYSNMIVDWI